MKTHLNDLSSNRADILQFETQRIIRSKQISLVRELEALGTAMSSHPLNTLSQRYAMCKKKRSDFDTMRTILGGKVAELDVILWDYRDFVNEYYQGKLAQLNQSDVDVNYPVSEFYLIKDFLENSNQGQLYAECEQLRIELTDNIRCQTQVLMEIVQIISQYGKIIEFYPQNHIENHRLTKLPYWYRFLLENSNSITSQQDKIKQIMAEFHSTYNIDRVNEHENVSSIFFHLQTRLTELSYQRDVCLSNLYQIESQTVEISFDNVKKEFQELIRQKSSTNNIDSNIHELCKLIKRMMTVEFEIFNNNQEVLTDLMINDRWFLDEVGIQTTFLNNLIDIVTRDSQNKFSNLSSITKLLSTLSETVTNFNTALETFCLDVLPLALKSIITEDESTMNMIANLSNISNPEIINLLYQDLLNPNGGGSMRAMNIIQGYSKLVEEYQQQQDNENVSMGKNVFLSLHNLFEEITKNTFDIVSTTFNLPTEWLNLIELKQASGIMTNLNPSTVVTLNHLFMAERVKTMIDFFSVCLETTLALKGSGSMLNLDQDFLCRPLKRFICNYYTKFILGRVSFCLSCTICCLHERKLNCSMSLDQIKMTAPSNKLFEKYFMLLEEKLRTEEFVEFSRQIVRKRSAFIINIDDIFNTYQWMHADILQAITPSPRNSLLMQLQKCIQTLSSWKASIAKIDEELQQCSVVVMQRLKWAAGANPLLNELMKNFEIISTTRARQLEKDKEIVENVIKKSCAILNYEMMRFNTHVLVLSDDEFLNLLKRWENVCVAMKSVANTINPVEESLVELLDPEGNIDRDWIEKVTSLIDDIIHKLLGDIDSKEKNVAHARDSLDMCAHKLRNFIATHHRISTEVKSLMKSILKHDESEQMKALRDYREKHKTFMENISELHGNVLSKDFTDTLVKRTSLLVDESLGVISEVYNDLFKFEQSSSSNVAATWHSFGGQQDETRKFAVENYSADYPGSPMKKGKHNGHD